MSLPTFLGLAATCPGGTPDNSPAIYRWVRSLEYLDVLQRPRVLAITGLTHKQSADLVTGLIGLSHEVQIHFAWRPNLADETDNKFVEAAIHASATIVTYNQRDFLSGDLQRFGWSVISPREFVAQYL